MAQCALLAAFHIEVHAKGHMLLHALGAACNSFKDHHLRWGWQGGQGMALLGKCGTGAPLWPPFQVRPGDASYRLPQWSIGWGRAHWEWSLEVERSWVAEWMGSIP